MPKKITIHAKCLKCNHPLMDYKSEINGKPSIHVKVKNAEGDEGDLWLCSYYGCLDKKHNIKITKGENVQLFCPNCNELLNTNVDCKCDGDGKMVKFSIEMGGIVSICSKMGCPNHYIMIDDLETTLQKFAQEYDF